MKEIEVRYGIMVKFDSKGSGIYIAVPRIEEALEIIRSTGQMYEEIKWKIIDILCKAKECNASLREIRSLYGKGKINISFEFENWEDFLDFKKILEEHSL